MIWTRIKSAWISLTVPEWKIIKANENATAIIPPSPDQLAQIFAASLLASGRYDDAAAAVRRAWWLVPEFYVGRREYVTHIAPAYFSTTDAEPPTVEDTPEEMGPQAVSGD